MSKKTRIEWIVCCAAMIVLISEGLSSAGLVWTQATNSASWYRRVNHGSVALGGRMWVFGGSTYGPGQSSDGGNSNDVWYSTNGVNWSLATGSAPWYRRIDFATTQYNERMWVLGGSTYGPGQSSDGGNVNDVWYSTNGVAWTQATGSAPWYRRVCHSAAVHDGRMWIAGGSTYGPGQSSDGGNVNDVWYTTDGATWSVASSGAPWYRRVWLTSSALGGRLWFMGGSTYGPGQSSDGGNTNDVWYSTNGSSWTQAAGSAPWYRRIKYTSNDYAGSMWVIGGSTYGPFQSSDGGNINDVWFSANGASWTQDTSSAPWYRRVCHTSVVHDGKLWVLGGSTYGPGQSSDGGNMNDVWVAFSDADTDGIADSIDNCVSTPNAGQQDADTDGVGDACDNCDFASNAGQTDSDSDGFGDACDLCPGFNDNADADGDDVPDGCDACPGFDDNIDCNTNGTPDACDISGMTSGDCNASGVPDECEAATWAGSNGGDFLAALNWQPVATPEADAVLRNTSAIDNRAILDASGLTSLCGSLTIEATATGRQILQINAGSTLSADVGTNVNSGGEIDLRGGELTGGSVNNASNTISGYGIVSANVANAGLIEGRAGVDTTLLLAGNDLEIQSTGTIRASLGSLILVSSAGVSQTGDIEARGLGGVRFDASLVNLGGGHIRLLGGVIGSSDIGGISNVADGEVSGFGIIDSSLTNDGQLTVIADTQIVGDLANDGTVTVQSGLLTVTEDVTGSGVIIGGFGGRGGSCGGLVINGSYILGENATLSLGCGTLKLGGNFDVAIDDYERFDMTIATLQMAGLSGTQLLETLADDAGTCPTLPEPTLFSIGTLRIGPTPTTAKLVDAHVNSVGGSAGAEVLYVRQLTIESGARLDLGGKTLYYATSTPANPTTRVIDSVGGGRLIQLGGGGALRGDVNGDCRVDLADLPLFIQVLLGLDTTPSRVIAADVNGDARANSLDVSSFLTLIMP